MEEKQEKILVVGLARSGMAAIDVLHKRGAAVSAYDRKAAAEIPQQSAWLNEHGIPLYAGSLPAISRESYDLVIVSPGVPMDASPVKEASEAGIAVIGELELAYRLKSPDLQMYAVTGTNGKTTTTALLHHILQKAQIPSEAGGNIGTALCSLVDSMPEGVIAVEASSFQLETIVDFRPHISGILNITPDHLDRHKNMEKYIAAKARIFLNQQAEDVLVLNYEDASVRELGKQASSQIYYFSNQRRLEEGFYIHDQNIVYGHNGNEIIIAPLEVLRLRGKHNLENVLCATAMAWAAGVSGELITKALADFQGVRHRMEEVAEYKGVLYINDSKGTNPDSTIKALEALDRPIILIAGGRPKGNSYDEMAMMIRDKVKDLILLGEARDLIKRAVIEYDFQNIHEVEDFPSAVYLAHDLAKAGDVVLLSPACASWDMFPSYEHRGDLFCQLVREIIEQS